MQFADEIIFVPTEVLTGPDYEPNAPAKRRRRWKGGAFDMYGGHEGLLVRTALLRSDAYDPQDKPPITCAHDVFRIIKHIGAYDQEHIIILALNNARQVTAIYEAGIGPADHAAIDPRTVMKILVLTGANACVIAHNHPSGNLRPSPEDRRLTTILRGQLECLGFSLLDHLIVADDQFFSFLEHDLTPNRPGGGHAWGKGRR